MTVTIELQDEVNIRIKGLPSTITDALSERFTYWAPNFKFQPSYRIGRWDGKIRLFQKTGKTYFHFLDDIIPIIDSQGYDIHIEDYRLDHGDLSLPFIDENYLADYTLKGNQIILREYQLEAVNRLIENGVGVAEMATGSGKSLTCAAIAKLYSQFGGVVTIVPTVDLVLQTKATYDAVGIDTGIWYGDMKDKKNVLMATWQSLNNAPELFHGVKCVIVDEVHKSKAKVIGEMLSGPAANVPIRFGCSGTLPKEALFRAQIKANLGPTLFSIRTWELQEKGVLADTHITQVILDDNSNPHYHNAAIHHDEWKDEVDWMFGYERRIKFIAEMIKEITKTGNTLVLVQYREHGKLLAKLLPEFTSIDGRNKSKERFEEYKKFDANNNVGLIATAGIASTGIDITRIHNFCIIEVGKKFETIMQMLGRGVRKGGDKDFLNMYDFASNVGFSKTHARQRKKWFDEARQSVEVLEVTYL